MGQYYAPCILKKNWKRAKNPIEVSFCSHRFDNGLKLMEHSYVRNSFVTAMCYLLANNYFGRNFAWVGDYADNRETDMYNKDGVSFYDKGSELWEKKKNLETEEEVKKAISYDDGYMSLPTYKYIVNLTKNEYIKIPKFKDGVLTIHPLPLLCADGNGRGGGDYFGKNETYIGRWAYDKIGITNDRKAIIGLEELKIKFKEQY